MCLFVVRAQVSSCKVPQIYVEEKFFALALREVGLSRMRNAVRGNAGVALLKVKVRQSICIFNLLEYRHEVKWTQELLTYHVVGFFEALLTGMSSPRDQSMTSRDSATRICGERVGRGLFFCCTTELYNSREWASSR